VAAACATLAEFLATTQGFETVGDKSTGQLTISPNPTAGDTFTISDLFGDLPVVEAYEAGPDFTIGASAAETAGNIAAALNAGSALVDAEAVGAVVYVVSKSTGPWSELPVADGTAMVWGAATLEGGSDIVDHALACTCCQINVGAWGTKASCGHIYLAAHVLALQTGGGGGTAGGEVKKKTIDKLSIEYNVATATQDDGLSASKWGRLYLTIRETIFVAPIVGRCVPVVCC
jgi:hypothetical protein